MQTHAPVVWLLTDNKPGHRNQLKGVGNRLRVHAGVSIHWLDALALKVPLWRAVIGLAPTIDRSLPPPDLIIGAGTSTHRLLLALRRKTRAKTVVLMKPAFPLNWVDAAIIPQHDRVKAGKRVLITTGSLNGITPLARITDKPEALILTGGPSPHFNWDNDVVFDQINHLIATYPDWRWTISSSRRTPAALADKLQALAGIKITVVGPDNTHADWLAHQLAASRAVWVTPDSMSMVSEAATSGVPAGLLQLIPHTGSRVAQGIDLFVERGYLARWSDHAFVMSGTSQSSQRLWESDRAARWLIQRFLKRSQP
ncbi:mitochondrial fission ELM1 family protein [Marinobacter sp.]|uniref:mitochondrial fission ELM1 family protein n=1 Tax=Marinobacter sp. TaxID=50741 RepID=UPI0034A422FA